MGDYTSMKNVTSIYSASSTDSATTYSSQKFRALKTQADKKVKLGSTYLPTHVLPPHFNVCYEC